MKPEMFEAIYQAAVASTDDRYRRREAMRPLMPQFPGFRWIQIERGLTVPVCEGSIQNER